MYRMYECRGYMDVQERPSSHSRIASAQGAPQEYFLALAYRKCSGRTPGVLPRTGLSQVLRARQLTDKVF